MMTCAALTLAATPAMASGGTGSGGGSTTTTTTSGGTTSGSTTTTTTSGGGGGGGGGANLVVNPGFNPVLHPGASTDWEPWIIGNYALYKSTGFNGNTVFTQCRDTSCLGPDNFTPGPPWDLCSAAGNPTDPACTAPYLTQAIATTPGKRYDISFEVAETAGPNSAFALYWDGQLIAQVANPANNTIPYVFVTNQQPDAKNFVKFTYPGLLATTSSTRFELKGYDDAGAIFFGNPRVTLSAVQ